MPTGAWSLSVRDPTHPRVRPHRRSGRSRVLRLEGYLKAVSTKDGAELWKFKTPSGIIGNVFTYRYDGKQYVGVYSGIGGWAALGMAAGLTEPTDGLGTVGGYKDLARYTRLGGSLFVFALPD